MRLRQPRDAVARAFAHAPRPRSSTPWRQASWCALDLELTGLDTANDDIIAVGAVPIEDCRVTLGESFYTLVRATKRSTPGAILTHKLRSEDLEDAPPLEEVFDRVLEVLTGRVPVFHAAAVERGFLTPVFARRRLRLPAAVDTEVLGRLWLAERDGVAPNWVPLTTLATRLGQRSEAPHHALGDALTTANAFVALASHLDRRTPQTVGTLLRSEERVRGYRRMA